MPWIISIFLAIFGPWIIQVSAEDHFKIKEHISLPPYKGRSFAFVWNVNDTECDLDDVLSKYGILHNEGHDLEHFDKMAIFYQKYFRYLPRFDRRTGKSMAGGLPQNGSIKNLTTDFGHTLENMISDFNGLGVLDWESWTALYYRTNSAVYKKKSLESVRKRFPNWTQNQQENLAKFEYETATRSLMESALNIAKISRPRGHWGFYLYPDCRYYNQTTENYHCTPAEKRRNDELQWLFDQSTGIFPSVYFPTYFQDHDYAIDYVAGRIYEALKADAKRPGYESVPVFSYHMLNYKKQPSILLNVYDLINSIGVASVLGGSGVVLWRGVIKSNDCSMFRDYLTDVLGPFCAKMADNAKKCSEEYCHGHGRCVVGRFDGGNPPRYLTEFEAAQLVKDFKGEAYKINDAVLNANDEGGPMIYCQCYPAWKGRHCDWRRY